MHVPLFVRVINQLLNVELGCDTLPIDLPDTHIYVRVLSFNEGRQSLNKFFELLVEFSQLVHFLNKERFRYTLNPTNLSLISLILLLNIC